MVVGKMRNFVKRVEKKERSGSSALPKHGRVDHHKDYARRAKRTHIYENVVKGMEMMIRNKNEDEFYYAMENARTVGGVKIKVQNRETKSAKAMLLDNPLDKISDDTIEREIRAEKKKIEEYRQLLPIQKDVSKHIIFEDGDDSGIPDKKFVKTLRKHAFALKEGQKNSNSKEQASRENQENDDEEYDATANLKTKEEREIYARAQMGYNKSQEHLRLLEAEKKRRMIRDAVKSKNVKITEKQDGSLVISKNNRRR